MSVAYVVHGAECACSMSQNNQTATISASNSNRTVNNKQICNMMDIQIGGFGNCTTLTAMASGVTTPCPPKVPITPWLNCSTSFMRDGLPVVTEDSMAICPLGGGVITFNNSGQGNTLAQSGANSETAQLGSDIFFNVVCNNPTAIVSIGLVGMGSQFSATNSGFVAMSGQTNELVAIEGGASATTSEDLIVAESFRDYVLLRSRGSRTNGYAEHKSLVTRESIDSPMFRMESPWQENGISNDEDVIYLGFRELPPHVAINNGVMVQRVSTFVRHLAEIKVYKVTSENQTLIYHETDAYIHEGTVLSRNPKELLRAAQINNYDVILENEIPFFDENVNHTRIRDIYHWIRNFIIQNNDRDGSGLEDVGHVRLEWQSTDENNNPHRVATLRIYDRFLPPSTVFANVAHRYENRLSSEQQEANARYIFYFLTTNGFTPQSAAAILGNIHRESHFNPGVWQFASEYLNRGGYGLIQWDPARPFFEWAGIDNAAEANNMAINDPHGLMTLQLNFFLHSLRPSVGRWLSSGRDTSDGPIVFHAQNWRNRRLGNQGSQYLGFNPTALMSVNDFMSSTKSVAELTEIALSHYFRPSAPALGYRIREAENWARRFFNY